MTISLDTRLARARELRAEGYNCSQCVAMVFDDATPLSAEALALATAALGGGIAGTHGTCGCVSAMGVVKGAQRFHAPADKMAVYAATRPLLEAFDSSNGSLICAELRRPGAKPCIELIEEAVTLLHNSLND